MNSESQCSTILKRLKRSPVSGVANYRFPQLGILCYSKRIQELREGGYKIVAERQVVRGRHTGTWVYRLIQEG